MKAETLYSFEIDFKKFVRSNPTLEDVQAVYVRGICIIAKNQKFGGFYTSKYVKKISGKFMKVAGSNSYPILYPKCDVKIFVENFPREPKLDFSEFDIKYKPFLSIGNIQQMLIEQHV